MPDKPDKKNEEQPKEGEPKQEETKPTPPATSPPPPAAPDVEKLVEERVTAELARRQQDADRKTAETQGEFERLYNEVKPQLETVTAERDDLKKQNGKLTKFVNTQIDAEIAAWPEIVRLTDPGADDLPARMAWADKLRPKIAETAGKHDAPQDAGAPGSPAAHAPGANGHGGDEAAARASQASLYRGF
jgi:hypothetical protein